MKRINIILLLVFLCSVSYGQNIRGNSLWTRTTVGHDTSYTATGTEDVGDIYYDKTDRTLSVALGNGVVMQVNQESLINVYNNTSDTIPDGRVCFGTGVFNGDITIDLASKKDRHSALLITTEAIPPSTKGLAVELAGKVRGVLVGSATPGPIYLDTMGYVSNTQGVFPDYNYPLGAITQKNGTATIQFRASDVSFRNSIDNILDGVIRETFDFRTYSDGTNSYGVISNPTGDTTLTLVFSTGWYDFSVPDTVQLVSGAAKGAGVDPQMNYVYIPADTRVLTVATGGFPTDEYAQVSKAALFDAASTQTDGAIRNQNINNHFKYDEDNGHIVHIGDRIRVLDAAWESGVAATLTGTPTSLYFTTTDGKVWQMHLQDFDAHDMSTGDDVHVVNDPTTAYRTTTDLADITVFSDGSAWNNEWSNLVLWGVCNKSGEVSHIMVNLPSDGYLQEASAYADASNYSNYTIPREFRGVGFLIGRFTVRRSGGNWTYNSASGFLDLRGFVPNTTAGGGAGGGAAITEWTQLNDIPNAYTGFGDAIVTIASAETGAEFTPRANIALTDFDSTGFKLTQSQIIGLTDTISAHRVEIDQINTDIGNLDLQAVLTNGDTTTLGATFGANVSSNPAPTIGDHLTNKTYVDTELQNAIDNYTETDPIWTAAEPSYFDSTEVKALPISTFTNDAGYITGYNETDPIYSASSWFGTTNNSANWNTAFSWGNHATQGYLTSYTETDPVWTADKSSYYTSAQVDALPVSTFTNDAGYITSADVTGSGSLPIDTLTQTAHGFVADDWIGYLKPQAKFIKASGRSKDSANVIGVVTQVIDANTVEYQYWGIYTGGAYTKGDNYFLSATSDGDVTTTDSWNEGDVRLFLGTGVDNGFLIEIALGDEFTVVNYASVDTLASYLPLTGGNLTGNLTIQTNQVWHAGNFTDNSTNWNTAYGWGDHSLEGYLTSYTETDPIYSASSWFSTTNNSTNWNTAYTHSQVTTGNPHSINATDISDFDTEVSNNSSVTANTAKVSFPEAPNDGQQYARQSLGWTVVEATGGGTDFSGASAYATNGQAHVENGDIALPNEHYDTHNYHDLVTNNARITVPDTGYYLINLSIRLALNTNNDQIQVSLKKNGTIIETWRSSQDESWDTSDEYSFAAPYMAELNAGDYLTMIIGDPGGTISGTHYPSTYLQATKMVVGPAGEKGDTGDTGAAGDIIQDVANGDKTASFTHNTTAASIGNYNLSTTGAVEVSLHNLSSGKQGTVFLDVGASNPSSVTVKLYSDAGSTEISAGNTRGSTTIETTANQMTSFTYTCASDGTNTEVILISKQGL